MRDDCYCSEEESVPEECFECGDRDVAGQMHVDGYGRAAFCGECYGPARRARDAKRKAAETAQFKVAEAKLLAVAAANGDES